MADIITAPINYAVIANGGFVSGGSVAFGAPNVRPDPANPATLKAVYLDLALTTQAQNPQPLDSNAVFDQSSSGVLYGADDDQYSIVIFDRNGAEISYQPVYDLSDANAAATAQQSATDAMNSQVAAEAAEQATDSLFTDFVNRYFGPFASDPTVDDKGNTPNEGSLYWNTVSARFKVYDSGVWIFPTDLALGTAAYADLGAAPAQVPTNADLPSFGTAAEADTGAGASQVPLNSDLPTFGTAAEADVQASPTDATAGALLNNETTHIGGNLNYTEANYQPETVNGIGVVMFMRNESGSNINQGATVSGAVLRNYFIDSSNNMSPFASGTTGSWLNVGTTISNNQGTLFTKVAN